MATVPETASAPDLHIAGGIELPIAGQAPAERCDAVRNRRRILEAAARLFAEEGVEAVSVDRIAAEAGVGKGTVFRRFGDRGGLLWAVLSEREAAFQEECIRGPAPLGPGADPLERLLAFGPAYLRLIGGHGEVFRAAETGAAGARLASAPYAFKRAHVALLLSQAAPGVDAEFTADALLGLLSAELIMHQREDLGLTIERQSEGWCETVRRLAR